MSMFPGDQSMIHCCPWIKHGRCYQDSICCHGNRWCCCLPCALWWDWAIMLRLLAVAGVLWWNVGRWETMDQTLVSLQRTEPGPFSVYRFVLSYHYRHSHCKHCWKFAPVRGQRFWRRTGIFLKKFFRFYVYDLRFKAWGPTTFLIEFQTLIVDRRHF